MQIAEKITPHGMTSHSAFNEKLTEIILEMGLTKVIETGTFHGQGTTSAILKGLLQGEPFTFYSIEVNPDHYKKAKINIGTVKGLHLLNGLSVDNSQKPTSATFDLPDFVVIDHYPENRDELYRREINFNVPDNQLDVALRAFDYLPHLVVLDSVGNMGMIEFRYLMDRVKSPFILALDDTCHVKHYDTMEFIRTNPKDFTVLWEVESEYLNATSGSKFGSAIIQVL